MSELLSDKNVVDAEWYLATYPDVATIGMDPHVHYELHGCTEGRFPRLLKAVRLENALWSGFARLALPDLHAWWQDSEDFDEQAYAAWALARWFASASDWPNALPFIPHLIGELPPYLRHLGPTLLSVEILLRNGRHELAQTCLQEGIERHGLQADMCLAAANAGLSVGVNDDQTESARRLAWLNRAFESAGLKAITLRHPQVSMTLDNLQAGPEAQGSQTKQPKISVVMPAFNADAFIETALRSLLEQSWRNLEIIVVDDCSTDSTAERVSAMAHQDARILLLRQTRNWGAYAARNAALNQATGDFLINHDSDDWSHPQRLELMVRPLLENHNLVATMADWVRADTSLHFQCWRIADRLIEPSVSTMMVRREAVQLLGGWDEVRVAADHELHQRLLACHGTESVLHVRPGVPLVIARYWPESLTMSFGTHLRSTFFGLRQLYSQLAQTWHSTATGSLTLGLPGASLGRAFPAPAPMLSDAPHTTRYDWLLISDLSADASRRKAAHAILKRLIANGEKVALFHWPDYHRPESIDSSYLSQAVRGEVDIVLAEQCLEVGHVVIVGRHLLANPLDQVPHILGLQDCQVIDSAREVRALPDVSTRTKSEPPELFSAQWYLQRYPDIRTAGVDAWQHYLANGAAEGRDPGPDFNTAWYLQQCPQACSNGQPALLHYMETGHQLGYEASHPTLPGYQPHRPDRPTVLLCAHAANEQIFGAERCLLDVLDACGKLELNVVVSVPGVVNRDYVDQLQARALSVVCIPTMPWQVDTPPCAVAVDRFAEVIRTHAVDLVQVNTIMLREPLLAARQAGIPSVIHAHESPLHDSELCESIGMSATEIIAEALERADHVLANSAFTAQHFAKAGATHVIGNIIDSNAFDLANSVNHKLITAALISSNLPKKGLQDLQELAQEMKDTPNLHLLLIGPDNKDVEALRRAQADGELSSNLRLVPYTASSQEAIAQTNIVLNLSHCQETFGRTLLEGMAARRPVLAYRWGALPELIDEGVNGFTFEHGDVQGLAKTLRRLCRKPQQIRNMGKAGRQRAMQYTLERLVQQLGKAYAVILQRSLEATSSQ
ncbi:glycosyltransferase [Pseudomonas capeferrum]|uniref:glycosyltransferase n=1 Tax=Pseudomonas capeferrum TaxID=1495066 RepID=UPI0015E44B85|nr:glycosyltransferase [Pseudomonas capeferrum]MBA1204432.1 glycosyltransferase [Pseudomonas capeferrum]